jgi:hypothetical protein
MRILDIGWSLAVRGEFLAQYQFATSKYISEIIVLHLHK